MLKTNYQIKSNQIKSLLLSHHHSTSALVSEILMSVLQTVQKNNRQFTYGQTVQKKTKKNKNNLHMDRQCKKLHWSIYSAPDSAKKNNNSNLHMDRQCKKLHWSIYSAPDSAKKNNSNLHMDRQCKKKQKKTKTIYIWTDSAKNCTGAFTVLQTVQKKTTTAIYIWTDSAKNCTGAFTVLQTVQKKTTTAIYIWTDSAKKTTTAIYIWTDSAKKNNSNLHMDRQCKKNNNSNLHMDRQCKKKQQQFTYGQYIFTDCTEDNVQNTHTCTQYA